jgi:hypothetical protein
MSVDFRLNKRDSLLTPETSRARTWVRENMPDLQMFGAALVIAQGSIDDVVEGIVDGGLTVGPAL